MTMDDIDFIGVTYGPGLIGSLLIGVECAKTISLVTGKPLIPVHHIAGHIYANNLKERLKFPLIALVVSGGHTDLVYMKEDYSFERIGSTLDDAVGEAYDKVAKILGLDYPGGPIVDKLAKQGKDTYDLPYPLDDKSYNFSFSGIKSAVVNMVHNEKQRGNEIRVDDMCTSFQNRVVSILTKKTKKALEEYKVSNLIVAGGVAANKGLRESLTKMADENNINLSFPELRLCTDNAAMIGAAAYYAHQKGIKADLTLNAKAIDSLYVGTNLDK
jgi:N6-L-threonylcarbamoyladenine synthase